MYTCTVYRFSNVYTIPALVAKIKIPLKQENLVRSLGRRSWLLVPQVDE